MKRVLCGLAVVLTAVTVWALDRPSAVRAVGPPEAGSVRFVRDAGESFEPFVRTRRYADWLQEKFWRIHTYSPYFDHRLRWFRDAWVYQDLQAIYPGSAWERDHPEWILRDAAGAALYVPYDCSGGTCPQYAADIGDQAFREAFLQQTARKLRNGYRGVMLDDVNMTPHVGNGLGQIVLPIDKRTGQVMTAADWNRYMAEFVELIRARFPGSEIVHNGIWWLGAADPFIQRQLRAADVINLERGVNDPGIVGGTGPHGLRTLFAYVDRLHTMGKPVVFESSTTSAADSEYGLAAYFLVSSGRDGIGNDGRGGTPKDWWAGYDVRLGAPLGKRRTWKGVLRRDFRHGTVLLNEPQARTRSLKVGDELTRIDGSRAATLRLRGGQGAVLLRPRR
jgi:hypothetical protein